MAKRNDFLEGFLRGLYNSGVGNPDVQRQNELDTQTRQAKLDADMAAKGMTRSPAPTPAPAGVTGQSPTGIPLANANTFPQDHPIAKAAGSLISRLFGGSSTPLQTAYHQDPDFAKYYLTPEGDAGFVKGATPIPQGSVGIPADKAIPQMGTNSRTKPKNITLVYDPKTKQPRIEPENYIAKPGELAEIHEMGDALSKVGSFTQQEGRTTLNNARTGQIGIQTADDYKKNVDPSNLSPTSAIGSAARSVLRTVNALSLMEEGKAIPQADLEAAQGDIDTIVSQSAATVQGREMLKTKNIFARAQELKSYFASQPANVPVPENVVKIYRDIVKDLGPVAQKTVTDYVDRNSKFFRPQYSQFMSKDQMDAFDNDVRDTYDITKRLKSAGKKTSLGSPGNESPEDQQAIDWANKNPTDPRAIQIKKLHGL